LTTNSTTPATPARVADQARGQRRRSRLGLIATAAVVVIAATAGLLWRMDRAIYDPLLPDSMRTASGVNLPHATKPKALATFLRGRGAPLAAYAQAVPQSLAGATSDHCAQLTTALMKAGTPMQLAKLASAAPDPAVADAATASVARVASFLGQCHRGHVDGHTRHQAEFTTTVLRRLLSRGVAA
jgi:hypothetical protein